MTAAQMPDDPDWVRGHAHEPNPSPPPGDGSVVVRIPDGSERRFTVEELRLFSHIAVPDCYITSTGHGTSGPFTFGGVRLDELLDAVLGTRLAWHQVDIVSQDGFGVRLVPDDVYAVQDERYILLADTVDGAPLTRERGLIRLIVPSEQEDALRQVKWVSRIEIRGV